MEWKSFYFPSKIIRFPYENSMVSEGNSTILPMERKCICAISPMKLSLGQGLSRVTSQSAIAPITSDFTVNEGSFS